MSDARRHPAEVTLERLLQHYEQYYDRLTTDERDAISAIRAALWRIADEDTARNRERDALETIIPEVNPVKPGDRFAMRDGHNPATCRNGDHYGQCPGATLGLWGRGGADNG